MEAQVDIDNVDNTRLKLSGETKIEDGENEKEEMLEDAKSRQVFNPIDKIFDYSKRRVTDLRGENNKIYLPKLGEIKDESEMEMIRSILVAEYKSLQRI